MDINILLVDFGVFCFNIIFLSQMVKIYIFTRMHLDINNTSYRFLSISNDFDIHFRLKCIYNKISVSPPTSLGTYGNAGFLGGEDKIQRFTQKIRR